MDRLRLAGHRDGAMSSTRMRSEKDFIDWLRVIEAHEGGPAFRRAHYGEDHRDQVRDLCRAVLIFVFRTTLAVSELQS